MNDYFYNLGFKNATMGFKLAIESFRRQEWDDRAILENIYDRMDSIVNPESRYQKAIREMEYMRIKSLLSDNIEMKLP